MISFKQLEAIYWVGQFGTFAAAAEKLHTSESAISKRITELETGFGIALFDRTHRSARLTRRGVEVTEFARDILSQRNRLLERMGKAELSVKRFRLGVTELVALTWLPKLVERLRGEYPDVALEPEIDLSIVLCEKLSAGTIDFAIVPPVFAGTATTAVPLQKMELTWMCKPGLVPNAEALSLDQLAAYPILAQAGKSGVDTVFDQWFQQHALQVRKIYAGNSLVALAALTASGFGVSYLPSLYFKDHVTKGLLQPIRLTAATPTILYHGLYRKADEIAGFCSRFAQLCAEVCDFSKPPEPDPTAGTNSESMSVRPPSGIDVAGASDARLNRPGP